MPGQSVTNRKPLIANRQSTLSWHGFRLDLPDRWDPVKLEGDAHKGMILLADLHRPRLGVRWAKLGKKADVGKSVRQSLLAEVGQLAAGEAVETLPPGDAWCEGRLYLEPEPPGRDVWIGYSQATGRLFELVYHARHRDRGLAETVLPTLVDGVAGEWLIFDLACRTPPEATLTRQLLNVGDLRLDFAIGRSPIVVRQIAVASVAITRQPIEKWLQVHQNARKKHYRPLVQKPEAIEWTINGQAMKGFQRTMIRRRRHFYLRLLAKTLVGVVLRDESRDKLLIAEAVDEATVRKTIETM